MEKIPNYKELVGGGMGKFGVCCSRLRTVHIGSLYKTVCLYVDK